MNAVVFDIEGDGLVPTKIHCFSYYDGDNIHSLVNYDDIREFISTVDVLIGHNIQRFDIPVLERILKIKIKAKLRDTLLYSWYLEPERLIHGLDSWGEFFGVQKPKVNDWENLPLETYIHRCEEDVKINSLLWRRFKSKLTRLYGGWDEAQKFLDYLEEKMDAIVAQEKSGWALDVEFAKKSLQELQEAREGKLATLVASMPKRPVYVQRRPPAKPFKRDGTLSVTGSRWQALLRKHNLPEDYRGEVEELVGEEEPNPNSSTQVKDWLYSLGWKPETFKYDRDKETGDVKKIPQINLERGAGLCPSVRKLDDGSNGITALDSLGIINHRIGLINGFLRDSNSGALKATVGGLTNTLRWQHSEIVNLPKVSVPYGEMIRGSLIAREDKELCGSDMVSLEDRLKQHYIYPYDPDYVEEMNKSDYDPHLSLALLAGAVTKEQVSNYILGTDKRIKPIRDIFKSGNYACQYGAGPARLALTAGISKKEAERVYNAYWKKNWAVKKVAENQKWKTIDGQMWLYNPVSTFWYSLRYEKDIFSTLVQGTASFVFDCWVSNFRRTRRQLTGQFHDEVILEVKKGFREQATKLLKDAIEEVNDKLKLNRRLDIEVQFGNRYSEIH